MRNVDLIMRYGLGWCALMSVMASGCASGQGGPALEQPVAVARPPSPAPAPAPAATREAPGPESLYILDEAFEDVMASPLAFIGTGEWYGEAPYPPCAYKNDRVLVIDQYCTTNKEIGTFSIDVFHPTKGWFSVYAFAAGGKPISETPRAKYDQFIVHSSSHIDPAKVGMELSFDMTYRELSSYAGAHSRARTFHGACWEGEYAGYASGCNREVPEEYATYFAERHRDFIADPGERWYELVRYVVSHRRHPWPKPDGFEVTPDYLRGRAVDFGRFHRVGFMRTYWDNVGNDDGLFAPLVATDDGGYLLVGNRGDLSVPEGRNDPLAVRVDHRNEPVWETSLARPGYADFEASSAVVTRDGGLIVYVLCYPGHGSGPVNRLVKLDRAGAIVWDWIGRGRGGKNTPHATRLQLTRKGTVRMTGHVYKPGADIEHGWTGEVDAATGALLRDEDGGPDPYKRRGKGKGK